MMVNRPVISVFSRKKPESREVAARRPQVIDFGLGATARHGSKSSSFYGGHRHMDMRLQTWPGKARVTRLLITGSCYMDVVIDLSYRGKDRQPTGLRSPE